MARYSKKEYQEFATILNQNWKKAGSSSEEQAVINITNEMIRIFKKDNPHFDEWKFMEWVYNLD